MTGFPNVPLTAVIGVLLTATIVVPFTGCKHAPASSGSTGSEVAAVPSGDPTPSEAGVLAAGPSPTGTAVKCAIARQYLVIVDNSLSRNEDTLTQDKEFLKEMIQNLCLGDQIVLQQVHYNGPHDDAKHWSQTMPIPASSDSVTQDERDKRLKTCFRTRSRTVAADRSDGYRQFRRNRARKAHC